MSYEHLLASRTSRMGASAIREILKVVSQPGMISLAGGIPAPESFPLDAIRELTERVVARFGSSALQYDLTEGFPPLREALANLLLKRGITARPTDIYVTSGSQGILDGIGKILIDPGDAVAVEAPTYLGALQAFNPYEPSYVRVETDNDGLIPESLEELLRRRTVKFLYLVPTFQNPSGRTLPLSRRKRIAEIALDRKLLIVEDDPYSALRYEGEPVPSIHSIAPSNVVYSSTLSKVFAPGLRIGFCLAPPPLDRWLVLSKQGVDLHTSTFNQALATEYLEGGYLDRQLPRILQLYKPRLAAMLDSIDRHFPASFSHSSPQGGMFVWAEGPSDVDTEHVYHAAIKRNVAFVPGRFFFTEPGEGLSTMRLNFTMSDQETIARAVETLGGLLRTFLSEADGRELDG